jgi:hypothetical protein
LFPRCHAVAIWLLSTARVDDPAGVTRMAVKDATERLELVREGRNVADFASADEWGAGG